MVKRPLTIAAGGFVFGEMLALIRLGRDWKTGLVILAAAGVVLGRLMWRSRTERAGAVFGACLLFTVFALAGCVRLNQAQAGFERELAMDLDGRRGRALGVIRKIEEKETYLQLTLGKVRVETGKESRETGEENRETADLDGLLVYLDREDADGVRLYPGIKLLAVGELERFPGKRNPGVFDASAYYRSRGLAFRMYADHGEAAGGEVRLADRWLLDLRSRGMEILNQVAGEDAGIFQAAILGDKGNLDGEMKALYQDNGIAHLLAISGLHMSLIGMGFYRLLRRAGAGYGFSVTLGAVWVVGYGMLTGSSPSVNRAVIMLLCAFLADLCGRTYDLMSASCLSCVILLFQSPWLAADGGAQLSFGAVWAIGAVSGPLIRLAGLDGDGTKESSPGGFHLRLGKTLAVSLSVQLVTYPVILYHFYQYPVYGILLNLIVIPLMTYVVISGLTGILLGSVWTAGGVMAVGSGHYILQFYEQLCRLTEQLPVNTLILGQPEVWKIAVYYGILLAGFWAVQGVGAAGRVTGQGGADGSGKAARRRCRWFAAAAVCAFFWLFPSPVSGLRVTFLDVGQGDGILLETGRQVILVDGGSSSERQLGQYTLTPCLKSRGISKINYAVVSHGDKDHISGLQYLLNEGEIRVETLIVSCQSREEESIQELIAAALAGKTNVYEMKEGDRLAAGGLTMTCLFPGPEDVTAETNDHSLVLRADYGNCGILLTGDAGQWSENRMLADGAGERLSGIQILKAGHHGSRYSTTQEFLDAISPGWAIISCSSGNSYGHPHPELTERLETAGITVLETRKMGAVILRTDGKKVWWGR